MAMQACSLSAVVAGLSAVATSEAVVAAAVAEGWNFANKVAMESILMEVPLMEGGGAIVELAADMAIVGPPVVCSGQPSRWGRSWVTAIAW